MGVRVGTAVDWLVLLNYSGVRETTENQHGHHHFIYHLYYTSSAQCGTCVPTGAGVALRNELGLDTERYPSTCGLQLDCYLMDELQASVCVCGVHSPTHLFHLYLLHH